MEILTMLFLGVSLFILFYILSNSVKNLGDEQKRNRQYILEKGNYIKAKVIRLKSFHGGLDIGFKMGGTSYELEYSVEGVVYRFYSDSSTDDPLLEIGKEVEIMYLEENPKKQIIIEEDKLWKN